MVKVEVTSVVLWWGDISVRGSRVEVVVTVMIAFVAMGNSDIDGSIYSGNEDGSDRRLRWRSVSDGYHNGDASDQWF